MLQSSLFKSLLLLLVPLLLSLTACESTGPDDPNTNGNQVSVLMSQVTELPRAGGDVTGVDFGPDNTVYAVMDGKLYKIGGAGSTPQLINGEATHTKVAVASTGDIYTVTPFEFRTYVAGSSTPTIVPFDPAGPLATNGRVEDAKIVISPAGVPFVLLVSNYPRTYIYYSTDKGATWKSLKLPNGSTWFNSVGDIGFTSSGVLLAGNYEGLFRSGNLGETWAPLNSTMPNFPIKLLTAANGDIYRYVPGGGGLDVSHDGGINFIPLTQFNKPPFFIQVNRGNTGALYALANSSSSGGGTPISRPMSLYRSTDGGATWQRKFIAQAHEFAMRNAQIALGLAGEANGFMPGGVSISEDLGTSWEQAGLRKVEEIESFTFDKNGTLLIRAEGGIFRQTSSGWDILGSPLGGGQIASSISGGLLVAGDGESLFSGDDGGSWQTIQNRGSGVLSLRGGGILTYGKDGIDHVSSAGVVASLYSGGLDFKRIIEDADGTLYGTYEYLDNLTSQYRVEPYHSTDGGASWQSDAAPPPALAFNSLNNLLGYGESGTYVYGGINASSRKEVSFTGFSVPANLVRSFTFDRNDRLWILSAEGDLYESSEPLK